PTYASSAYTINTIRFNLIKHNGPTIVDTIKVTPSVVRRYGPLQHWHHRCRLQRHASGSFADFFSAGLLCAGEEGFADSFVAEDFSPASAGFDGDSFLAASLYESLR